MNIRRPTGVVKCPCGTETPRKSLTQKYCPACAQAKTKQRALDYYHKTKKQRCQNSTTKK